ncbi:MAG: peptidoglycan-binding protein [Candidatus Magasanikbacteria bacterium]|jgi:peptidoglycan hydrolase-like protein with peptidoglycan-binding domain
MIFLRKLFKYNLLSVVFLGQMLFGYFLLPAPVARAASATYYVDATSGLDANNGTSIATPWKTISKVNNTTLSPGDTVLFKRGETWAEQLTPKSSGTVTSSIIFSVYGDSGAATITGGTYNLLVSAKNYLSFNNITFTSKRAVVSAATGIVFNYCVFKNVVGTIGLLALSSSTVYVYNSVAANNDYAGISGQATSTIYLRNSMVIGNGQASYYGLQNTTNANTDYDYNIITGNNYFVYNNLASSLLTDGGHNLKEYDPDIISYASDQSYFGVTIDDHDVDYVEDLVAALSPYNVKVTMFTSPAFLTSTEKINKLRTLAAGGHEIAIHGWSHTSFTVNTTITVTTTNSNPTINIDQTNHRLILACDEVGNNVTMDWSGSDYTLDDLRAAVAGKGWGIDAYFSASSPEYRTLGPMKLSSLTDSGGVSTTFPYVTTKDTIAPNYSFWNDEVVDSKTWIGENIGVVPNTVAYPYGDTNTAARSWLAASTTMLGARAAATASWRLNNINLFNVGTNMYGPTLVGDETFTRANARHLAVFAKTMGAVSNIVAHYNSDISVEQWVWLVDEIQKIGGTFYTFNEMLTAIRSDHNTTNSIDFTKTYADNSNYDLLYTSPGIDAGTDLSLSSDIAGNPIYGAPDIGAYEYQPPYTIGSGLVSPTGDIRIYADGKYRYTAVTTSLATASFSVAPAGDSYYTGDRRQYLDVSLDDWETSGDKNKQWTASSTIATTTIYTIGDLEPNSYYSFHLDGVINGAVISSDACQSNGTCLSDDSGEIVFTYTGGYSNHVFSLEKDTTPPAEFALVSPSHNICTREDYPSFSWNTSSDSESGLEKYQLYINDVLERDNISTTTTSVTPINSLSNSAYYTWYVVAVDKAGNRRSAASFVMNCNGPGIPVGAYQSPLAPDSGFQLSINDNAVSTDSHTVKLSLVAGSDTVRMAISNNPDFINASQEVYRPNKDWVIESSDIGPKTVYVKFYTVWGQSSPVISDTILLTKSKNQTGAAQSLTKQKNLKFGDSGDGVRQLQQWLITLKYLNINKPTGYFGLATKQAVIKFQKTRGIISDGIVNQQMTDALSSLIIDNNDDNNELTVMPKKIFINYLYIGSSGAEVRALQQALKNLGFYNYHSITGYFGSITKQAVINFQKAKGIKPYPGWVGPSTREALNDLR